MTTINVYTKTALQLADLEELTGADGDHLANLIGIDGTKYTKWVLGQGRMFWKYADRCRHLEDMANQGLPLMLAKFIIGQHSY